MVVGPGKLETAMDAGNERAGPVDTLGQRRPDPATRTVIDGAKIVHGPGSSV